MKAINVFGWIVWVIGYALLVLDGPVRSWLASRARTRRVRVSCGPYRWVDVEERIPHGRVARALLWLLRPAVFGCVVALFTIALYSGVLIYVSTRR